MPKTPKRYRLSNRCLEQMNAIQEHHALPSSTAVIEFATNATYKEIKPMLPKEELEKAFEVLRLAGVQAPDASLLKPNQSWPWEGSQIQTWLYGEDDRIKLFRDENGEWSKPSNIWFQCYLASESSDGRGFRQDGSWVGAKPMQTITKTYVCTCEEWSSDETTYSSLAELQEATSDLLGNEAPELDDDNEDIFFFADGHREHVGHINIEADRALASVDDVILHVRSGAAFIVTEFDDPYADDEDEPEAVAIKYLHRHGYTMQSTENTGDQQVWER